jgi:hypothetical protein
MYKVSKKTKQIIRVKIKIGTRQQLADMFNTSTVTVSMALSGYNNSALAHKIREAAVRLGGDPIYSMNNEE